MSEIKASVGSGGDNNPDDVRVVQRLLNAKGFRVGCADGRCGSRTGTAIKSFQHGFLKRPDGRVDPGGKTWAALNKAGAAPVTEGGPLVRKLPKPDPTSINSGLTAVNNAYMTKLFGAPRVEGDYDQIGKPVTNPLLKRNVLTTNVGPFRVTGLGPAVLSLQQVMQEIQRSQPEVYTGLSHRGMLVVRYQRDSNTRISNHGWGCAIDIAINGNLDTRGDNMVQYGLTLIAPIFNSFGWYWGVAFEVEDGMHFEGGKALTQTWRGMLK